MKNRTILLAVAAIVSCAFVLHDRPTLAQERSDQEAYSVIAVKDQGVDLIERELTTKSKEGWTLREATSDFLIFSRRQSQPK
jgi:hypothetical protein